MHLLDVTGSAYDRGIKQGSAFSWALEEAPAALASLPIGPGWIPHGTRRGLARAATAGLGRYYLARHRRLLASHRDGTHLAALEGIASGSGGSLPQLYGFGSFEIESCNVPFRLGCTALGFVGNQTESGEPRLCYNHDFPPAFEPYLFVRRSRPRSGFATLTVGYPPLVGAIAGVNERGLAATLNQAYATDIARERPALLTTLLLLDCLEMCGDVDEAVEHCRRVRVTNGGLISLIDRHGSRAVVELSAGAAEARRVPHDDVLVTLNDYRIASMQAREIPVGALTTGLVAGYDVHRCNLTRARRLKELLPTAHGLSDAQMFAWLGDHDGRDGDEDSICRHGDPFAETIMSAVINPVACSIDLLRGKPCEQRAQRFHLAPEVESKAA
jgi:hypothetical protein